MQLTRYLRDLPILKKLLAINLAPALAFRDPVSVQQILRSLQAEANVIHARVNTQEGERYAKYATSAILRLREHPSRR